MDEDAVVDLGELAARAGTDRASRDRLRVLGRVVEAATARWYRGLPSPTPISCGECPDRLTVLLSDDGLEARWHCGTCGRGGIVHGWQGSEWDLGLVELPGSRDLGTWLEVLLDLAQVEALGALEELTHAPRKVVHGGQCTDEGILLHAPPEALAMLRDVAAGAAANAGTRGDEELLHEVHAILDAALDGA